MQHLLAQGQGHFQQTRLVHRAGQEVDAFLHFQRIAGGMAQHLVHVGDQGACRQPRAGGHGHQAAGQFTRPFGRGRESAAAALHIQHQALQAGSELFAEDAGGDQRHALHRGREVTDAVQPLVCRRQGGRSTHDGAAGGAQRGHQSGSVRVHVVAAQGFHFVQRAACVAQAAAADHRHHTAAGRDHGRQHQADLVAHTAGGVLVQHRPVQAGVGPLQHFAAARHRVGQCHRLGGVHATQQDGHGQRGGLAVAPAVCACAGQSCHKGLDLRGRQGAAVALGADDLLRQHAGSDVSVPVYSTNVMRGTGSGLGLLIRWAIKASMSSSPPSRSRPCCRITTPSPPSARKLLTVMR